jgi:hypothetical protein
MASIINATTTNGVVASGDNSGVLQLATNNGTTAVTIDTSQNVGIGTASPANKLHVAKNSQSDNTNAALFISDATTLTKGVSILYNAAANNAQIQSVNKGVVYTPLALNPEGSNVLIGTTTNNASGGVLQVSNGITFPATQSASADANTLDDYEEGTWTLTINPSSGSLTSYSREGRYVKIGQSVTIFGVFTIGTAGTASGIANISGLPFTAMSSSISNRAATGVARENAATGNVYQIYVNAGGTTGDLLTLTNGAIVWTNGFTYLWTITYITA